MLLSRVADRIYWAARYIERAEDTARIVRAHGELTADLPARGRTPWEPLVAIVGSDAQFIGSTNGAQQQQQHSSSSSRCRPRAERARRGQVPRHRPRQPEQRRSAASRRPARTCARRATPLPRDGWNTRQRPLPLRDDRGRPRRRPAGPRALPRPRHRRQPAPRRRARHGDDPRRGVRDVAPRAGARAGRHDDARARRARRGGAVAGGGAGNGPDGRSATTRCSGWACCARCTGLQMYQRAVRGPIEGPLVVRFLLEHDRFPRAVRALLREIRRALGELPDPGGPLDAVDHVEAVLRDSTAASTDGAALDDAMDALQVAIAQLDRRITERYLRVGAVSAARRSDAARAGAARRGSCATARALAPPPGRGRPGDRGVAAPATSSTAPAIGEPAANGPWRLDPIPLVLDGDVFDALAAAVARAGARPWRRCSPTSTARGGSCATGWVPAEALASSAALPAGRRRRPAAAALADVSYAVDVVAARRRHVAGRAGPRPTRRPGVGYALLDRSVMARVAAELLGPEGAGDLASISGFPAELRHALAATTPAPQPADRAVLRRASTTPAYVEHSSLARLLGFHLVEAPDLVVRQGRLWLRTLGGLDPIDVVYRRARGRRASTRSRSARPARRACPACCSRPPRAASCWPTPTASGVLEDPALARVLAGGRRRARPASRSTLGAARRPATSLATVPAFRDGRIGIGAGRRPPARRRRTRRRRR